MKRNPEQLHRHYLFEKQLANKLLNASREERRQMYSQVYDELFRNIPDHPQMTRKSSPEEKRKVVAAQMRIAGGFLNRDTVFLEIGPGDCSLSLEAAKRVKQVYAVDVSDEITKTLDAPGNFRLVISDSTSIPVPKGSATLAYSADLIEHLHPEDAIEQLQNIHAALAPGGKYICITPNRLCGPWDISMYFDTVASGFHLKEYTLSELARLFRNAGFRKLKLFAGARGRFIVVPARPLVLFEALLQKLPHKIRKPVAGKLGFLGYKYIRLMGTK